jgi:hypothetical protein
MYPWKGLKEQVVLAQDVAMRYKMTQHQQKVSDCRIGAATLCAVTISHVKYESSGTYHSKDVGIIKGQKVKSGIGTHGVVCSEETLM